MQSSSIVIDEINAALVEEKKRIHREVMQKPLIKIVEDSLSAQEARILKACSKKEQSGFSDDEISEVAEKAKATLLANIATLSINSLMPLTKQDDGNDLTIFGKIIKDEFTGKEFDAFFALAKARNEYIDDKNDDFGDEKESRLNELVQKASGIIIAKIEPLQATEIFTDIENALGESN